MKAQEGIRLALKAFQAQALESSNICLCTQKLAILPFVSEKSEASLFPRTRTWKELAITN